jgi:hypothetical protein
MEALRDVMAGAVAGILGVVVTMPLDVVRVRQQVGGPSARLAGCATLPRRSPPPRPHRLVVPARQTSGGSSFVGAATGIVRQGGLAGLFRGVSAPVAAALPTNAIIFAAERYALDRFGPTRQEQAALSVWWSGALHGAAGAFAGALQVPVAVPAELCKIQLQTRWQGGRGAAAGAAAAAGGGAGATLALSAGGGGQAAVTAAAAAAVALPGAHVAAVWGAPTAAPRRVGLAWLAGDIVARHGLGGLYRGAGVTLLRDTVAFAAYFGVYDGMKRTLSGGEEQAGTGALMVAGGTAGVASWLFTYPIDVVKTHVQAAPLDAPRRDRRMLHVLRERVRLEGARGLTRGLSTTLVRAFACSAIVFPVFEWLMEVGGSAAPHGHQDEIHK